jgi:acylphosphatase
MLVFRGRFQPESFREFVWHRAKRLALRADVRLASTTRMEVSVAGAEELIDAFELACSLGPIDCLVRDHHRIGAGADLQAWQGPVWSLV